MMKKIFATLTSTSLIALTLAACTQPELPQDHYYRLNLETETGARTQPVLNGILEVERFRADGLISGRPIAYLNEQGHLSEYHYHFWVEPPVDLLQDAMVKFLRSANVARHVVTPDLRMDEDFLLTGQIKRLERVMGAENKVAVEVELGLKESRTNKILVLKTYNRELSQQSDGMQGAVNAINGALSDIYKTFLSDIK